MKQPKRKSQTQTEQSDFSQHVNFIYIYIYMMVGDVLSHHSADKDWDFAAAEARQLPQTYGPMKRLMSTKLMIGLIAVARAGDSAFQISIR